MSLDAPSWLVAWLRTVSVWDAALWVVGAVLLVWFVKNKAWRGVVAFARGIVNSAELLAAVQGLPAYIARADKRHEQLSAKVDGIYHETHNNDGSSIKDSVDRIEMGVKGLYPRVDTVEEKVLALNAADEALRAELEDTRNPKEES